MNIKTTFLQAFRVPTVIGLLSILSLSGLISVPQASADTILAAVAIEASPTTICVGQSAHITWGSVGATSVSIDQGFGAVALNGDRYVSPTQTTTYTIVGSNTSGGYGSSSAASATVFVSNSSSCYTPTPTPYPTPPSTMLACSASNTTMNSGDVVTFYAWDGNGDYSWTTPDGVPSYAYGSTFSTRFYNSNSYSVYRTVTVHSGYQSKTCGVTVYAGSTWTPAPTPTANPTAQISASKTGRNVTRGQTGEYSSLTARGGDTLDFIIRVRSTNGSYLYNAYITDFLPSGFAYIAGSTTLNGYVTANGVSSFGLNVGAISPYADTVLKFSARVDESSVPTWGTVTVNNTAQIRADGLFTRSVSLPITLGTSASIAAVSTVKTGPADSLWLALATALFATAGYAAYTRTNVFGRRVALAEVSQLTKSTGLNFSR